MIVTTRKPKPRTKAQADATPLRIPTTVTASEPGPRRQAAETVDPEAENRVKAWFATNVRLPGP